MIEINFGEHAGRKRSFKTANEVLTYIRSQREAWSSHPLFQGEGRQSNRNEFGAIRQPWSNLETSVGDHLSRHPEQHDQIPRIIHSNANLPKAFSVDSNIGKVIADIAQEAGTPQAAGALKFFLANDSEQVIQQMSKLQIAGVIELQQRLSGLSSKSITTARNAARNMMASLSDDVAKHRQELAEQEQIHATRLEELVEQGERQKTDIEEWRSATEASIAEIRSEWDRRFHETYDQFTEKLRIEAPVKLWNDRAATHQEAARVWQRVSILAAIVGMGLAALFAWGALSLAAWLFADAFVVAKGAPLPSGLRPTWQYEVIFASGATLLYLTVFFWVMRIVVRMYMTEHHLAIDATSRASMAETYLALIKEAAATDQDRAIVLASLFRPIVDGIVKDDGLPAITPAAIISGLAVGKPSQ